MTHRKLAHRALALAIADALEGFDPIAAAMEPAASLAAPRA